MPELPEVETIRNNLRRGAEDWPSVLGRVIEGVELYWDRTLAEPEPAEFIRRVVGQQIEEIGRRGKFMILHLTRDKLIFHLRMSGDLLVEPQDAPIPPHHRLILNLSGGMRLSFNDTRKFGRAWFVADTESVLSGLGPEPFSPELTPEVFYERLQQRKRQMKPLLLDQTFLAGMGNIYTDEALNLAKIHPLERSDRLTREQSDRLLESIRTVLKRGIETHGASIDWVYRGGDFQNYFRVYQRTGLPCPECGTVVERIVVGQRSTHYCPSCQPEP